jgi:uncharacterized NAD(P)/FAD-binding protein YdhS
MSSSRATSSAPAIVVVGAGPTGIGVLERLVASAPELSDGARLQVHLVDPHPPGGGRVWRAAQPSLLWANSLTADVTVLPDRSVTVAGPVGDGTTLWQWVEAVARTLPAGDPVGDEARRVTPTSFPSRPLVNAYLGWVLAQVVESARPWIDVHLHAGRASDVRVREDGVTVQLADGRVLTADLAVLAQGHLDAHATPDEQAVQHRAAAVGATYLPTAYTADLDLSCLTAGEPVLVRGAGLAFADLMVLLTSGRGGRFEREGDRLHYLPSGREPVLYVGSRRGVPYRAKLGYVWPGPPVPLHFFTPEALDATFGGDRQLDLRADLAPVIARELGWAHYTELFRAHPERTTLPWAEFAARFAGTDDPAAVAALVETAVPDPADRFDLAARDRPLAGQRYATAADLQEAVRAVVRADLDRSADPEHSTDAAVFTALLFCHGTIAGLVGAGRLTPRSEAEDLAGWWMNLFSYLASGPPAPRLAELLALSEAGVLRFLGADAQFELDPGAGVFRAGSGSVDEVVEARAMVEARVPAPAITATPDELMTSLVTRGVAAEKLLADPDADGAVRGTGRLHVDAAQRVMSATGQPQDRLFAVGFWTSGAQIAAFARPRTNAPFFRQNDALARRLWQAVPGRGAADPLSADAA